VEVDADVAVVPDCLPQFGEAFGRLVDEGLVFHDAGGPFLERTGFEGGEPFGFALFHPLDRAGVGVDAGAGARRAAEQLVDGHTQRLAFDIPKGLVHPADRAREDRATPVERVPVHRLPMMGHRAGVLADQVGRQFLDGGGDRFGPAFHDRFSQAGDACVGVDLEEEPARLDQERLDLGDLQLVAHTDHRRDILVARQPLVLGGVPQELGALVTRPARRLRGGQTAPRRGRPGHRQSAGQKRATIKTGLEWK